MGLQLNIALAQWGPRSMVLQLSVMAVLCSCTSVAQQFAVAGLGCRWAWLLLKMAVAAARSGSLPAYFSIVVGIENSSVPPPARLARCWLKRFPVFGDAV